MSIIQRWIKRIPVLFRGEDLYTFAWTRQSYVNLGSQSFRRWSEAVAIFSIFKKGSARSGLVTSPAWDSSWAHDSSCCYIPLGKQRCLQFLWILLVLLLGLLWTLSQIMCDSTGKDASNLTGAASPKLEALRQPETGPGSGENHLHREHSVWAIPIAEASSLPIYWHHWCQAHQQTQRKSLNTSQIPAKNSYSQSLLSLTVLLLLSLNPT